MTSDLDLLRRFERDNSQDAFAEIVRRHLNLVYSAALRQVRSPQLAEDIAQSVFADLARNAGKLGRARREECLSGRLVTSSPTEETVSPPANTVTPWLYAVTRRTAVDVIRKESRRQLREQIAVEMNNMNATANDWTQIAPLLDDAMAALDETDRSAVLLRYFENKSLREVGEALGATEDAAQKRVSRAVEKLREFFSREKIAVGASGLAVLISANAVQSAPVGLATAISTTTLATTQTVAMTMMHKFLITGVAAAVVGTGIYSFHLQKQIGLLQQQRTLLGGQIEQLGRIPNEATNQLAGLQHEIEQLGANETELLKLRNDVTPLRQPQETQTETVNAANLVTFFKQAIDSPPDIEHFTVKRTNLQAPQNSDSISYQYFEGALSGTNFYLRWLPDPDLPADSNHLGTISARSGSSTYEIGGHGITYGVGNNALTASVNTAYRVSREILSMEVGGMEPGTVKWDGNAFTAKNIFGKDVRGQLQVSNDLPFRLELTLANEAFPYAIIQYTYATPADSFAGYPGKFLIFYNFYRSSDGLKPLARVEFKSVQLAARPLGDDFFSETRYADRIGYVNMYRDSDLYAFPIKSDRVDVLLLKSNRFIKVGSY